jgi:hypothetical protein
MGLSSSKQTTTSKSAYEPQVLGAYGTLTNAFNQNQPKVQQYADQIGGLIPSMVDKYQAGNPAVTAAQGYITDTLGRDPGQNPHLDEMIARMGGDTANTLQAQMGTRGLTGGTAMQDILSRNLSRQAGDMRYNDWNAGQQRRAQAAGMAPGVAAADTIQIAPLLSAAQVAGGMPMDAASQYAGGVGGLLGQYQNQTTKKSPSLGGIFGSLLGGFAGG